MSADLEAGIARVQALRAYYHAVTHAYDSLFDEVLATLTEEGTHEAPVTASAVQPSAASPDVPGVHLATGSGHRVAKEE